MDEIVHQPTDGIMPNRLASGDPVGSALQPLRTLTPTSPEEAADMLGVVDLLEKAAKGKKAELRQYLVDEVHDARVSGQGFVAAPGQGSWARDFADDGLLLLLGGDTTNGLVTAWREGLIGLSWRWTQLDKYAKRNGLALGVHRPADGEWKGAGEPHVIETWKAGLYQVDLLDEGGEQCPNGDAKTSRAAVTGSTPSCMPCSSSG